MLRSNIFRLRITLKHYSQADLMRLNSVPCGHDACIIDLIHLTHSVCLPVYMCLVVSSRRPPNNSSPGGHSKRAAKYEGLPRRRSPRDRLGTSGTHRDPQAPFMSTVTKLLRVLKVVQCCLWGRLLSGKNNSPEIRSVTSKSIELSWGCKCVNSVKRQP